MDDESPADFDIRKTILLVQAAQGGDREALENLFARYLPRVRQIVAMRIGRRLKDFEDLEDITQESLIKALKNLQQFEARSEGSFRHWMAACVQNAVVDHIRIAKAKKRGGGEGRRFGDFDTRTFSSIVAAKGPSPSSLVRARETAEQVEGGLLQLAERDREAIVLRCFCKMSYSELAETLALGGENNARQVFSRAVHRLKGLLNLQG